MISITTAAQQRLEQVVGTESSTARLVRVAVVRGSHGWVHSWRLEIEDSAQPDDVELGFGRLGVWAFSSSPTSSTHLKRQLSTTARMAALLVSRSRRPIPELRTAPVRAAGTSNGDCHRVRFYPFPQNQHP